MTDLEQFGDERSFVPARGFEHDEALARHGQLLENRAMPRRIIAELTRQAGGPDMQIERRLRDINADPDRRRGADLGGGSHLGGGRHL